MDFFEKAHVLKKQPSKSEENMKKQLKQMLYGYKNSDNELIKSSANVPIDVNSYAHKGFDDSTSVSGFSDLNLSISDNEASTSRAIISNEFQDVASEDSGENTNNSSSTEQLEDSCESRHQSDSSIEKQHVRPLEDSLDSISEYNEGLESLSEDIEISEDLSTACSDDFAFTDTSTEGGSYTSDSEEFDPDGSLALKILERLGQKDVVFSKKGKKRKIENAAIINKKISNKNKLKVNKQNQNNYDVDMDNLSISKTDTLTTEELKGNNDSLDSESTNQSSPFISVTASEMHNQSLDDILGDYRYSTVRNLPSEKQNIIYSINNSGIFGATDTEMQIEDVDSLIPELGDNDIVDLDFEEDTNTDMPVEDSTAVYDTVELESERELSTEEEFVNPVKVFYGNNSCIVVLKHPAELYVNGRVKLKPLGGTVEVFGYTLKEEVQLYAPNNNFAHCIKTVENINAYYGLFSKLTSAGLTVAEAEEIVTTIGEYDGIISMSTLKDRKVDFVEDYFHADLFRKPSKNIDNHLRKASLKLGCSLYVARPWRFFEENESWSEAISCGLHGNSRGIICGGKGLGKSTFLRYYVNKMLENGHVLVIDLDPGQSEFTVAGNVSATVVKNPLIGPNFTHLKTPDIMLNIGMINTMDNATRYATAVSDLLAHCHSNPSYRPLPWIINTMGMCNNMGLKLITFTILHAQPTFLLQIDTKIVKKRFDCRLQADNIVELYHKEFRNDRLFRDVEFPERLEYDFIITKHVEGSERHNTSMPPKDERYLNFLAYFGELINIHKTENLLGIVPYEVKLSDLNIITNVKVAPEAVTKVINGKIVALCQLTAPDKGRVFTLDDKPLLCHGHGLVRGVDFEKETLYVISPRPVARLADVNALVYADWAPELLGQERRLPAGARVPYRTATVQQHKQLMQSPRRRFNPLQLLKMSRNT